MRNIYAVPEYLVSKHIPEKFKSHLKKVEVRDIHNLSQDRPTITDMAKEYGLSNFDIALPIHEVRDIIEKTGKSPVGHCVMDYTLTNMGVLFPITREGEIILNIYNHIRKNG